MIGSADISISGKGFTFSAGECFGDIFLFFLSFLFSILQTVSREKRQEDYMA